MFIVVTLLGVFRVAGDVDLEVTGEVDLEVTGEVDLEAAS